MITSHRHDTTPRAGRLRGALAFALLLASAACATGDGFVLEDHGHFEPPFADVNAPLHYMGVYLDAPVPHTQTSAKLRGAERALGDRHLFWDVGFGESFTLGGVDDRFDVAMEGLQPCGWSLVLDADVHMLLDFFAEDIAVINTDFRIGGGVQGRGLPWGFEDRRWRAFSWKLKLFHESTHLGDEYIANAVERQLLGDPAYADFRRVNVAFESLEAWFAVEDDLLIAQALPVGWRTWLALRYLTKGPWATYSPDLASPGLHRRVEAQLGGELRFPLGTGGMWKPQAFVTAADLFLRQQYVYDPDATADLRAVSLNHFTGLEWGTLRGAPAVFRLLLHAYSGINPRGQLRDQRLAFLGLMLQVDH